MSQRLTFSTILIGFSIALAGLWWQVVAIGDKVDSLMSMVHEKRPVAALPAAGRSDERTNHQGVFQLIDSYSPARGIEPYSRGISIEPYSPSIERGMKADEWEMRQRFKFETPLAPPETTIELGVQPE